MVDIDSSMWQSYSLLISGYCRNKAFMIHTHQRTFREFWEALAEVHEVPLDGAFMTNTTITSVLLVNSNDGSWLNDAGMLTAFLE